MITWLSDRARLVDLKDELEALRIRLDFANRILEKGVGARAKARHLRDSYAARILQVQREINIIEGVTVR